ncbi:ferritin family protein [Geomonas sp. RF6]|uniref:ferritin-like domain-containing protein n=1 Tax=Geomonas sp. RF6 TaxID=2897342 RepID=UPI001E3B8CCE|nr:ferritin family protein [Geomonas sp. RF6]UFS72668.1 ferritin family protein [Geomonas sp. RF6]
MSVYGYEEIVASAVDNEIEAFDFYSSAAGKVADVTLKAIFKDLAEEELKHREFLQNLLSEPQKMSFDPGHDYNIAQAVDDPKLSIWMKPSEAIALAIKKEEDAMVKYSRLATVSSDGPQKDMFEALSRMEQGHKVKLETLYNDMAFAEAW